MSTALSPRERLQRNLAHLRPDRISYEFSLTPALQATFEAKTGAQNVAEYYDFDLGVLSPAPTKEKADFSPYHQNLPEGATLDEWGVAHVPGSSFHFTKMRHPLATVNSLEELRVYPFPDRTAAYRTAHFEEECARLHDAGYFVAGWVGHIFETAWYMRGMDNLLVDFLQNPEYAAYLLDVITEGNAAVARRMAEAGFDMIQVGDDVGTQKALMMSPATWRQWLKPRLAREIAAAKAVNPQIHVWYHSDGAIAEIIPDLIEVGVDALNPVQPECLDLVWVKKTYGAHLTLWGTIGTQTTMPFGSPAEIKQVVRDRIALLGQDGGLVLAPTHVLEPDVPWENIEAFVEAMEEYGRL